jgi:hypothetical protein
MSRFHTYKLLYFDLFPIFVPTTLLVGFFSNLTNYNSNKQLTQIESFSKTIGYTSIVVLTGITYPISYPLMGCYFLYKNKNDF